MLPATETAHFGDRRFAVFWVSSSVNALVGDKPVKYLSVHIVDKRKPLYDKLELLRCSFTTSSVAALLIELIRCCTLPIDRPRELIDGDTLKFTARAFAYGHRCALGRDQRDLACDGS